MHEPQQPSSRGCLDLSLGGGTCKHRDGPYRIMVARTERVTHDTAVLQFWSGSCKTSQENVVPIEKRGREPVVLRGPPEPAGLKLPANAVAIHVAGNDDERIRCRIRENRAYLVA